jgi:glycyl-tRNA synthetase
MAFLVEAYQEEEAPTAAGGTETRMVLRLDHRLAPVKAAVLPLSKTDALLPTAHTLAAELRKFWTVDYDETQSIGKRYRRQDEVGTPFCITVDFETIDDQAVTIRARDTMTQDRVALGQVKGYLAERLLGA